VIFNNLRHPLCSQVIDQRRFFLAKPASRALGTRHIRRKLVSLICIPIGGHVDVDDACAGFGTGLGGKVPEARHRIVPRVPIGFGTERLVLL